MRKWAAVFLVLAGAVLFYVACGDSPTSPGTATLNPPSGPFGPTTGPFNPSTGPYGPGPGPGPGPSPTATPTGPGTPQPTPTATVSATPTPYVRITSVTFVASGALYNVVVDPNGVANVPIYTDATNFVVDGVFSDPEMVVTANSDALFNSDPLVVLNVSKKARVTVWGPGVSFSPNSFVHLQECPFGAPLSLGCWGFTGKGVTVTDINNPNFFTVPDSYERVFDPGQVPLGPRFVDNPPNDGSPQMYFVSVMPCGFSTLVCP